MLTEADADALVLARRTGGSVDTCRLLVLRRTADDLARRAQAVAS